MIFGVDTAGIMDELAAAGATHLIMSIGAPWNFDAVQKWVDWRDSQ